MPALPRTIIPSDELAEARLSAQLRATVALGILAESVRHDCSMAIIACDDAAHMDERIAQYVALGCDLSDPPWDEVRNGKTWRQCRIYIKRPNGSEVAVTLSTAARRV